MKPTQVTLPVVEIGTLLTSANIEELSSEQRKAAEKLKQAFSEYGAAYVRLESFDNGYAQHNIEQAIDASKKLFALPKITKELVVNQEKRTGITRGFLPVGSESGSADYYERKEAFSYSYQWESVEDNPSNALEARNVWPIDLEPRRTLERYYKLCGDIMASIVRALIVSVDDFEADMEQVVREGEKISLMRCFHYLSAAPAMQERQETGSVPHTDWGFATIVAQDKENSKPALQVFHDGAYCDVPPIDGTFVINCGDFLSLKTGGELRSPLHRVILTDSERYSLVYFAYPAFSCPMPPNTANVSGLSLYQNQAKNQIPIEPGFTFGEFIMYKWEQVQRATQIT